MTTSKSGYTVRAISDGVFCRHWIPSGKYRLRRDYPAVFPTSTTKLPGALYNISEFELNRLITRSLDWRRSSKSLRAVCKSSSLLTPTLLRPCSKRRRLLIRFSTSSRLATKRAVTINGTKSCAKQSRFTPPDATAAAYPWQLTQPELGGLAGEASISLPLGFG